MRMIMLKIQVDKEWNSYFIEKVVKDVEFEQSKIDECLF